MKSEELKGTKDKAKVLSLDDCVVLLEREKTGAWTSSDSSLKNTEFQRNGRCTKKARRKRVSGINKRVYLELLTSKGSI